MPAKTRHSVSLVWTQLVVEGNLKFCQLVTWKHEGWFWGCPIKASSILNLSSEHEAHQPSEVQAISEVWDAVAVFPSDWSKSIMFVTLTYYFGIKLDAPFLWKAPMDDVFEEPTEIVATTPATMQLSSTFSL